MKKHDSLLVVYIMEILEKYSNKENKLYKADIIEKLHDEYGLDVHRNTLMKYLESLREAGYISGKIGVYINPNFSDEEIKLVIDGVLYGQHVPQELAEPLIKKMKSFSPIGLRNYISEINYFENKNRTANQNLFEVMKVLNAAQELDRKVRIITCSYNKKGILVPDYKHPKVISPYYIVASRNRYYTICVSSSGEHLYHRRVDRIWEAELMDETRSSLADITNGTFDITTYMSEHFYMLSGPVEDVTIRIKKEGLDDFIDWFGKDYKISEEKNQEYYLIKVKTCTKAVLYWALQYLGIAEVIEPQSLREEILEEMKKALKVYGKEV